MKKIVKVGVLICCFIAIGSILYLRYLQFSKEGSGRKRMGDLYSL